MRPPERVTVRYDWANGWPTRFFEETDMSDYKPGEMDITVQEKTFEGFISMVTKASVVIILTLIFLALVAS
jgi:hypothetical protein